MRPSVLLSTISLLLVSLGASAQSDEDVTRRWAVDAQIGGNIIPGASSSYADVPRYRTGSSSNSCLVTKFHVEYYLPKSRFSLKAGYEHEEINFLRGDGNSDLNQLMLGARWYPAPTRWKVAPYVGSDILYAFGAERGPFGMDASMSWSDSNLSKSTYSYTAEGVAKAPRFSLGPIVGTDVYLFSSIALQVEYGYRFGVDSPYRACYTEKGSSRTSEYHGQMHRHVFSVGLKVTFPFRWASSDWDGLLDGLLDNL